MAFLTFRGSSTSPEKPSSTTAPNSPLTNVQIDGNFASLNDSKLELTGYSSGDVFYADANGTIARLSKGTDGQILKLTSGLPSWQQDIGAEYSLPKATNTVLGGSKIASSAVQTVTANAVTTTASRTYGIQMNSSDQLVVNVPWTDTVYTLPKATDSTLGGAKLGFSAVQTVAANSATTAASRTYGIQMNSSDQLVVNVPWTDTVYTLPSATDTILGGVKLSSTTQQTVAANSLSTTASRTYSVQNNTSNQLVVNVPWTDTVYALPKATDSTLGGIKLFSATVQTTISNSVSTTASRTYGVQMNSSDQLVVNVPWTDTVYALPAATDAALGGVKLGSATTQTVAASAVSATASRTYSVQNNTSNQLVVNVPWTDTTYASGTGLTLSSGTFSVNFGATSTTACVGNDARLSDARTPLAHSHAASDIVSGTVNPARLGSGTASASTFLRGDNTWASTPVVTVSDDTTTDSTFYPTFSSATTGQLSTAVVSSTGLTFNPSTGILSSIEFNSLSDARFKRDLSNISEALSKVKTLTGYTYTMIETGKRSTGLLAQEVELVQPESVGGTESRKTIDYGGMMGLIVEAIKELDAKLESIKSTLENK